MSLDQPLTLVAAIAPSGDVVAYDRQHLALYAQLLEAADDGREWGDAAADIMGIDVTESGAEVCWQSHLDRARWIVGEGLAEAIIAFGALPARRQRN